MMLVTVVVLAMASLDLVAAHWSLQRSLAAYSKHNQVDQASDWAQMIAVLYDEFGSWSQVQKHLGTESSLRIDGQSLGELKAVLSLNNGGVVRTQNSLRAASNWESAPILFRGHKVGTLSMQGYISPQVAVLKARITRNFDIALFVVVFVTSLLAFLFIIVSIRNFLKPLEQLARSAVSMTAGDFDVPLPAGGDMEIQNVVNAFSVSRQRLHEARQTRQKVLADIHHELRTPLNVIGNRLEAIHLGLFEWDEQTAAILHEETERIRTIVDDLEQLNEVHTGVQKLDFTWVVVQDWLPKLVGLFEVEAHQKEVKLRLLIPEEPICTWIDKNRMAQVVINLLANAFRYTPSGKNIFVKVEQSQEGVSFSIQDEGIGIDAEHLPFIFERFYRAEASRSRDTGGAGLGLAIVQEVVHAHGGQVTVRSVRHEGTCFRILLPHP